MMKNTIFAVAMSVGILVAGCAKDPNNVNESESDRGSLKVTLTNDAGSGSRIIGSPTQEDENKVFSFAVIVFNYQNGVKEKEEIFINTLTGMMRDLSTSTTKRVVVMVNYNFNFLDQINSYEDLNDRLLELDSQVPDDFSTNGLFMSGEYQSELRVGTDRENSITIPVRRIAAKVKLQSLTVEPAAGYSLDDFSLQSVSMQKVPNRAYMFGEDIYPTSNYWGGLSGSVSEPWNYLLDNYSLEDSYVAGTVLSPDIYFYVFPNNNSQDNATMLTLAATYNNTPLYYTFIINETAITGETDGTFIKRNMVYTLNITLRRLGLGGDGPDSTERFIELDVEIEVANWEGELIQNLEW